MINQNAKIGGLPALRPYQVEIGRAVLSSVKNNLGLTFTVEVARQGGKNELSAQIELLLLVLNMERGGNIIKCSPTFKPQTFNSLSRLQEKLKQAGLEKLSSLRQGHIVSVGEAKAIFYSAEPSSHVMGATAHLLLEVDEAQDVDKEKFGRDFKPMASSTNATTVLYGTTWDDSSLLEEVKRQNLQLEAVDGVKRHFRHDWREVSKYNPAYSTYVESERKRLGDNHPLFLTQYNLLTVRDQGRFLTPLQMAQMKGDHPRLRSPEPGKVYVAGLDLAGLTGAADGDSDTDRDRNRARSRRDAAVLTIAQVGEPSAIAAGPEPHAPLPEVKVVELAYWRDEPFPVLYDRLLEMIKVVWKCSLVVVDATGVGAGVAGFLKEALGRRVVPFQFTAQSKSRLGFQLLSFVNMGKIKVFETDGSVEAETFRKEMQDARAEYRANQTMNFYVEPSEGHDDYLMSLALAVEAAGLYRPRKASGSKAQE